MKNKKKVCVVGVGKWGMNHVATLQELGELGGIVEVNQILFKKIKKKYKNIQCYDNINDALDFGFNAYIISTPAETHYEIAKKIIHNGIHLLVEKPFTLNTADAVKLHKLALQKKVNLMVGHVLLFHPAFEKIKELIDDGILGKIQYIYSNRLNLGTIRTQENVFWSFAPHDIAIFQWLTNSYPKNISSQGLDILQNGIHDTTITTLEYPDRLMGHIYVSWLHPFKEHRFVVVGSKGMIRFEDSKKGKPLVFYDKSIKWKDGKPLPVSGETWNIDYENGMPLKRELQYFINHLNGKPLQKSNSESAIEVMQILENATQKLIGEDNG